jgi:hypothetical protein
MSIRKEVRELVEMGPLPDEHSATEEQVDRLSDAIDKIARPVTPEEALLLISAFGPDDCFGVAWSLLHLIETAPGASANTAEPPADANEWVRRLWARAERGRQYKLGK